MAKSAPENNKIYQESTGCGKKQGLSVPLCLIGYFSIRTGNAV